MTDGIASGQPADQDWLSLQGAHKEGPSSYFLPSSLSVSVEQLKVWSKKLTKLQFPGRTQLCHTSESGFVST